MAVIIDFYKGVDKYKNSGKMKTLEDIVRQKKEERRKALNELLSTANKFNLMTEMRYGRKDTC